MCVYMCVCVCVYVYVCVWLYYVDLMTVCIMTVSELTVEQLKAVNIELGREKMRNEELERNNNQVCDVEQPISGSTGLLSFSSNT